MSYERTKGPWTWELSDSLRLYGENLSIVLEADEIMPSLEDQAVIAAAPDMLAALKALIESTDGIGDDQPVWNAAREAISKAESRRPLLSRAVGLV